jgi:glycosyltransferase involved in cell wall biosynthesis
MEMGFRNLRVVARGVDTRLFDPARRSQALRDSWGAGPTDPVVLYVGRLAPEKNLPALVAALEEIRARAPQARFVLVGDGPESAAFAARYPDFVFAGLRVGEDLAAHYASGDIFLFPSLTETYGNVTVEAMASGLAIVAYDYAAAAEHLRHGYSGCLPDYDNLAEFARFAADLVTDPERIKLYGARARATALGLDWDRVVQQLEAVFFAVAEVGATDQQSAESAGAR